MWVQLMVGTVTLWDLLTSICFFIAIDAALSSAKAAKVGYGGYAFAITIGIVVGVCCAWAMRIVAKTTVARLQRRPNWEHSASLQKWFFPALYFSALVWIVFVGILGLRLSLASLHLFFRESG
jgi:hypothetical protein